MYGTSASYFQNFKSQQRLIFLGVIQPLPDKGVCTFAGREAQPNLTKTQLG